MKVLQFGNRINPFANWSTKIICEGAAGLSSGPGCGANLELAITDIFIKEEQHGIMSKRYFCTKCPVCNNNIPMDIEAVPKEMTYPTHGEWLIEKRNSLLHELYDNTGSPEERKQLIEFCTNEADVNPLTLTELGIVVEA